MSKIFLVDVDELNEEEISSLSSIRKEKASRFVFEKDKNLSLAAGIAFKRGLKTYGLDENEVELIYGEYGKPYLKDHSSIFFSLSHSGKKAIAVFDEKEIGCDIEKIRPFSKDVVERCFNEEEREYLEKRGNSDKEFTRIWVYKESFLKAIGSGISKDLSSFAIIPSKGDVLLKQDIDPREWTIKEIDLDGYIAAICYQK